MVIYLLWLCICLGLVIVGLLIDRTWLVNRNKTNVHANNQKDLTIKNLTEYVDGFNKSESEYAKRLNLANDKIQTISVQLEQLKFMNSSFLNENAELNDLLDLYIERDFERCRKKVIVKRKKKK